MNPLSPFGWLLIIVLVGLIIGINLSLFFGTKKKNNPDSWVSRLQEAGKTIRDPFKKEDEKLDRLSQKVHELKGHRSENPSNGEQNERS